jgi:hypothetical protein
VPISVSSRDFQEASDAFSYKLSPTGVASSITHHWDSTRDKQGFVARDGAQSNRFHPRGSRDQRLNSTCAPGSPTLSFCGGPVTTDPITAVSECRTVAAPSNYKKTLATVFEAPGTNNRTFYFAFVRLLLSPSIVGSQRTHVREKQRGVCSS